MKQRIGIVIPVYNREKMLRRTVESVVAQDYRPIHLVLVDNHSTDGSLALCHALKEEHDAPDFRVTVTEEHRPGASAARNKGLACLTEEIVSFQDSDDEYTPGAIARYMEAFEQNPTADIVGGTIEIEQEGAAPYIAKTDFSGRIESQLFHCILGTQRYAVKCALVRKVGGWHEDYNRWLDWNLGIRLLLASPHIVWVKEPPQVRVHWHADSITGYSYAAGCRDILWAISHAHDDVEESNHPRKKRLHKLLLYKQMVVAGLCRKEKSPWGEEIYRCTMEEISDDVVSRCFLPLVYRYVSWGGRGSAILADWLLR